MDEQKRTEHESRSNARRWCGLVRGRKYRREETRHEHYLAYGEDLILPLPSTPQGEDSQVLLL